MIVNHGTMIVGYIKRTYIYASRLRSDILQHRRVSIVLSICINLAINRKQKFKNAQHREMMNM